MFCGVYGGGSRCFAGFLVVVLCLFLVRVVALWVMLAGSSVEVCWAE